MDRYHPAVVENQTVFIERAVFPLLNSLTGVLLAPNSLLHSQLEENLVAWQLTRNTHDGQLKRPKRDVVIAAIAEKRTLARMALAKPTQNTENDDSTESKSQLKRANPPPLTCSAVIDSQLETKSLIGKIRLFFILCHF